MRSTVPSLCIVAWHIQVDIPGREILLTISVDLSLVIAVLNRDIKIEEALPGSYPPFIHVELLAAYLKNETAKRVASLIELGFEVVTIADSDDGSGYTVSVS